MYDYENRDADKNKPSAKPENSLVRQKYNDHRLSMDVLNGRVRRVKLSEAREAWSYGLPVSVVPAGAYGLTNDDFAPWDPLPAGTYLPFDALVFDQDYAGAIAEAAADGLPRKLTAYFDNREQTMMHFLFTDHSNPYLYRGTVSDCMREIRQWKRRYRIVFQKRDGRICYYELTEK